MGPVLCGLVLTVLSAPVALPGPAPFSTEAPSAPTPAAPFRTLRTLSTFRRQGGGHTNAFVHGRGLAVCRIILQPPGPFVFDRPSVLLLVLLRGAHLDLRHGDGVILQLARQRHLVTAMVTQ